MKKMKIKDNKYIIYKAQNIENGYVYVGSTTKSLEERKRDHIQKASKSSGHRFQEAISTYGADAFYWKQIDTVNSTDELAQKEKQYILKYNSKENGYNSDSGGGFKKTVYQYKLEDGSLIVSYVCLYDAGNAINATKKDISRACLSVNKLFGGYLWSYQYHEPFEPEKDLRKQEVYQLTLDEQFLSKHISVAEASRQTGISKTCISRVCRGERNHSGGFIWQYE